MSGEAHARQRFLSGDFPGAIITIRLTALALILVAGCALATEWTCSRLNETGLKEKLEYLKRERAALDGKCIAYAILQIGYSKEDRTQAIDTLVTF